LAVKSLEFERTRWRLFQKRVVRTKFDIYVFINTHCMVFSLKKYFDSESWRKTFGWTGEKKKYSDLTFSQYNHIQNVEEKQLFQHFAHLIKIRSAHLLPIFYLLFGPRVRRSNYTLAPRRGTGVYCFTSVCPSFQDIFRRIFLSNYWWQKFDIWSQVSYRYPISWEVAGVS
jgi:hypothetical protein